MRGSLPLILLALLLAALALQLVTANHHHHHQQQQQQQKHHLRGHAHHQHESHVVSHQDMTRRIEEMVKVAADSTGTMMAGAMRVDAELPVGVPLAGYNHGARRVPNWPLPEVKEYTVFMMPSTGVLEPTYVRALYIDNGVEQICFVSVDAIGADGGLMKAAMEYAAQQHFPLGPDRVVLSASHSHSGPGAVSSEKLWELAPATDLMHTSIRNQLASSIASAMVSAWQSVQPVRIGIGNGQLIGVTRNRRAGKTPWTHHDSIDPNLGVLRVDRMDGSPLAVLYNFASHGTCYGPENMSVSGDIVGVAAIQVEKMLPGSVALFANSDAGDIDPTDLACQGAPVFHGSVTIAQAVVNTRANITTVPWLNFHVASAVFDYGPTNMNLTLSRLGEDCDKGKGPLDICAICKILRCDLNLHLGPEWVETMPRYTAVRWDWNNAKWLMLTLPGEPLLDLGYEIRNDTQAMGVQHTFILGYSQGHQGYFAPPAQYNAGGYEAQLTFWGIDTAERVRGFAHQVAMQALNG